MATIYELVTAKEQARRWEKSELELPPYLGEGLSDTTRVLGTEFSALMGKVSAPRLLNASSYDAKVIYLPTEGFSIAKGEIPYFKNAYMINEKMRQELLKVMATNNPVYINAVLDQIINFNQKLLRNAKVTKEQLRMMLLTTGKIAIANNGQVWEYDFKIPAENRITSDWGVATADPVGDIEKARGDLKSKRGIDTSVLVMNTVTFNKLSKITNILNALNANSIRTVVPRKNDILAYFEDATDTTVILYDDVYQGFDGKTNKFVPDDVVVLMPAGQVIEEFAGTTPEEADLMSGATDAEVELVDNGVALTTWKEKDPVNVRTKVSMSYIPTLKDPNSIVIFDVKHNG